MSIQSAGRKDVGYQEDGKLCQAPDCGLPAIYRFEDAYEQYVYACDDHEHWACRKAKEVDCDDCNKPTSNWKIFEDSQDGMEFVECVLCAACYAERVRDHRTDHPDDYDRVEEDDAPVPLAIEDGDDDV